MQDLTLGKIYTLAEVAEHLRMTNRGLARRARRHGLCMVNGRDLLFTEQDIEALKKTMRVVRSEGLRQDRDGPTLFDYQAKRLAQLITTGKSRGT